jgi:DNA-binding response OmpR family regulator
MDEAKRSTIVVIDDEELIRYSLQKKLTRFGYNVISLDKAEDALYLLKTEKEDIDLVITDIKLRKMDGIELLQHLNMLDRPLPVLIITGQGNIEDAIRALRYGARDFIRKPFDINEVTSIVRSILRGEQEKQLADVFGQFMGYEKRIFTIPVDSSLCNVISYELTKNLPAVGLCNRTTAENISLALREAISNAMFHGNLEIPSHVREQSGIKGFNEEIERRKNVKRYKDRTVTINYELTRDFVEYVIEDEGPGFDYQSLPDPRNPENFFKDSGRGLLIIQVHMDEINWNGRGNVIKLRKYRIDGNRLEERTQ